MIVRIVWPQRGRHLIGTHPAGVDVEAVHRWMSERSYRAAGRSFESQRRAIEQQLLATGDAYDRSERCGRSRAHETRAVDDP